MLKIQIKGISLQFDTHPALFTPRSADCGTLTMLEHVDFSPDGIALDLGCGYGLVGILAASLIPPEQVYMTDIDDLAVEVSAGNLEKNGITGVTLTYGDTFSAVDRSDFTLILSNPPYHTDFSVAKKFNEKSFNQLIISGHIYMLGGEKTGIKIN